MRPVSEIRLMASLTSDGLDSRTQRLQRQAALAVADAAAAFEREVANAAAAVRTVRHHHRSRPRRDDRRQGGRCGASRTRALLVKAPGE
jgi:hypothetical protein